MKLEKIIILILVLFEATVIGLMLKTLSCSLYDAEFSKITYNKKLAVEVVTSLTSIDLRRCVTRCTTHPTCRSVNYNRQQQMCEFLAVSLNWRDGGSAHRSNLTEASGWNHIDTRNRNTVTNGTTTFQFLVFCAL